MIELPARIRNQRHAALTSAAVGLFVAIALSTLGIAAIGVAHGGGTASRNSDALAFRGLWLLLTMGLPVGGYSIFMIKKGILGVLAATRGTPWRWESERGGLTLFALASDAGVWAEGSVHLRIGDDVGGTSISSSEVVRAGLRDLARALDQDQRDLLVFAAFAGMIARSEIRVGPTTHRTWVSDQPTVEVPGWDARSCGPLAVDAPIERAIMNALARPESSPDEAAVAPYRGAAPDASALLLAATPLHDVWSAAWAATAPYPEEESPPRDEAGTRAYELVRERLREWLAREATFRDLLIGFGDERRTEPRLPKPTVSAEEPRPR